LSAHFNRQAMIGVGFRSNTTRLGEATLRSRPDVRRGCAARRVARPAPSTAATRSPFRAARSTAPRLRILPAAVHPIPLRGVAQDQPLERGVVPTRGRANLLARTVAFDRRDRFFETKHVLAVGLAPACRRQDRRAGGESQNGEALESPRRMAEELDRDAVRRSGMLVEGKHDDVAGSEAIENLVERAALREHAEARSLEAPGDEAVEPVRLDRPAQEMKAATHLREL